MFWIFILYLPLLCDSKIILNITVAPTRKNANVKFSGTDSKLVTHHEIKLFNLNKKNLNAGFRVELGRAPDGIFLTDPTLYGNLYHKYKWPEIRRIITVEKVIIEEIVTKDVVVKIQEHFNNSTDETITTRTLFTNVDYYAESSWSETGLPKEDIFYDVIVNFDNSTAKLENKWRTRNVQATNVKFGASNVRNVTLKPGQIAVKKLRALETIFTVEIFYKARLTGNFIADYENLYGKYHFYSPTVENILRAGNITNEIMTGEKIRIKCYTEPKVDIVDKVTGLPIKTHIGRKLIWKFKSKKYW